MNFQEKWKPISARISGIAEASRQAQKSIAIRDTDDHLIIVKFLLPEIIALKNELMKFSAEQQLSLPLTAKECLEGFLEKINLIITPQEQHKHRIPLFVVPFIAFRSQFEYLIQDSEIEGRSRTERAFEHLKRSIVVDDDFQNKWLRAFVNGEVSCEKLGAVHLLSHGIWAFKIDGAKARTDLIYHEQQFDESLIRRTASTLVLTEWKKVDEKSYIREAENARNQTKNYEVGVLGDIELKSTRYIILVSEKQLTQIQDVIDGEIKYRHINIPVKPDTPSVNSKKRRKE